jgi:type I restriction enzyme M protein
MVPLSEIAEPANDYNLNLPRYIDSSAPEDVQDLHAHLHGSIPDVDLDVLSSYWEAFPQLRSQLFMPNRPDYSDLTVDVNQVQQVILDSPEFQKFVTEARDLTAGWFNAHRDRLTSIDPDTQPNDLITAISDDLLSRFKSAPLLDEYDVYEQLMTYWHETMHDDVFLIMNDGWLEAAKPRKTIEDKDRKLSETPDLVIGSGRGATKYKMDLIPPAHIVARYFAEEQAEIDELAASAEEAIRAVEDYIEEHAVEDGLLTEAMDDGRATRALASARLRAATREGSDPDEIKALQHLVGLFDSESAAKKEVKEAQAAHDLATLQKYGELTDADVKAIVLDDKWQEAVVRRVSGEANALTLALVARVQQLGARYAQTLGQLLDELHKLDTKVAGHLAVMGVK